MTRPTNLVKLIGHSASVLALSAGMSLAGPDAMDAKEARHLLSRTGFGAAPHEINALIGHSYEDAVSRIVARVGPDPSTAMPAWTDAWPYPRFAIGALGQMAEELFYANRYLEIEELSEWWLGEMVATPSPLTERLVLFWHDHFSTSFDADEDPQWMANQNRFFRRHAAGNFREMAAGVLKDPAMLSYLSNTENLKGAPNENLGREYLELFTLGEGRGYSEDDVKEMARALTGHSISELDGGAYAYFAEEHDDSRKIILGQSGRFNADDLAALVTSHPNFGSYIVEKLWLHFVSDTVDPAEVARLAEVWKMHNLDLKPLLEELFLTDAFWSTENRGRLVKSPVELIVGAVRTFGPEAVPLADMSWASVDMGQELFFPPNVGGWPTGTGWITDATAVSRATMMSEILYLATEGDIEQPNPMMMALERPAIVSNPNPADLRVGQAFALEAEKGYEDGPLLGAFLLLFDVSFAGETFRSLPFYIEQFDDEPPEISLYVGDCAPACLFGASPEYDMDDPWAWVPVSDAFGDVWEDAPENVVAFLAALTSHLPQLLATTAGQTVWSPEIGELDDGYQPASYDEIAALADQIAEDAKRIFGSAAGDLVSSFSRPGALGLAGIDQVTSLDDIDLYFDSRNEQALLLAEPRFTYRSLDDWADTLAEGSSLLETLIAGPLLTVDPSAYDDPSALIEALILSPEFQLN